MRETQRVSGYVRDLKSPDPAVRLRSAKSLKEAATEGSILPALPELGEALQDPDDLVCIASARAIGNAAVRGDDVTQALPFLTRAVGHPEHEVQVASVWAIFCAAEQGSDISPAVPTLLSRFRSTAAGVAHWAAAALSAAVAGPRGEVVEQEILGSIAAMKAGERKVFLMALRASRADLRFALTLLAALSGEGEPSIRAQAQATIREATERTPGLVSRLAALLFHARLDVQTGASISLAGLQQGPQDSSPANRATERYGTRWGSHSAGAALMAHALRTLDAGSAPRILALLRTGNDDIRLGALRFLNQGSTPRVALAIASEALEPLLAHKGKYVPEEAALALATLAIHDADAGALSALTAHANKQVRSRAVYALRCAAASGKSIEFALPVLAGLLAHEDPYLRRTAACSIAEAARRGARVDSCRLALEGASTDDDNDTVSACREALRRC